MLARTVIYTHLAQAGRKHDDLIDLPHLFQEVVHPWSFYDVDIMPVVLDFDGDDIICL